MSAELCPACLRPRVIGEQVCVVCRWSAPAKREEPVRTPEEFTPYRFELGDWSPSEVG